MKSSYMHIGRPSIDHAHGMALHARGGATVRAGTSRDLAIDLGSSLESASKAAAAGAPGIDPDGRPHPRAYKGTSINCDMYAYVLSDYS